MTRAIQQGTRHNPQSSQSYLALEINFPHDLISLIPIQRESNALLQIFCKFLSGSGLKSSSYCTFDVSGIELPLACPFPLVCTNPRVVLGTTQVVRTWFV